MAACAKVSVSVTTPRSRRAGHAFGQCGTEGITLGFKG
jgi:hypothetical protein